MRLKGPDLKRYITLRSNAARMCGILNAWSCLVSQKVVLSLSTNYRECADAVEQRGNSEQNKN